MAWISMKKRCYSPSNPSFNDYGKRGITVCDRWRNCYSNFLDDVGRKPAPEYSIDRWPNNNGNYEPGNVRWAIIIDQQNNRRCTPFIEHNGASTPVSVLARTYGIDRQTLKQRLRNGWSAERALSTPVDKRKSKNR